MPTAEAALLALRQQQVIAEETGVASTVDPLGGSWFVEALTNRVEREVWRYLDEIDRRGGMVAAIAEGYPQREIADAAYRFQREFDDGRAGDRRRQRATSTTSRSRSRCSPCPRARSSATWPGWPRTRARAGTPRRSGRRSTGLREAASRPGSSESNLMPALPPLRRALRDARRAVPRPARGLRGVPGAGRGLAGPRMVARGSTMRACISMPSPSSKTSATRFRAYEALRRPDRRAARSPGRGRRRLVGPRPDGPHVAVAGGRARRPPRSSRSARRAPRRTGSTPSGTSPGRATG